jgi:U4/U6 small nuclear ribonucleoprotein PRP3
MRKKRRQEEQQDKRDRIRAGLIPPDPPKVRLANMMKVLTSDAVQDPTKLEARVRREVAMRRHGHEKMNTERKLTEDQRREKREDKKVNEEKKGLFAAVFKYDLLHPQHCSVALMSSLSSTGSAPFRTLLIASRSGRTRSR